jgi:ER-bound oxygenase mpaB/B'/Rubber oxygenase, catalytic domain
MAADRWTDEYLSQMRQTGDDLADDTVRVLFEQHQVDAVNRILHNLIRNDQVLVPEQRTLSERAQKALNNYLDQSVILPQWANRSIIELGEKLFMDYGMMGFSILGCASLPEAYATAYAATVLGITQQLQNHVHRRIYETSQFVVDVMSAGGLRPGGRGIRSAQKVRLMHAAIRFLILYEPQNGAAVVAPKEIEGALLEFHWPRENGIPIHQVAMSMAILSFSYVVLRSLRKLGIATRPEQESAYLHCWNVVGHIMGVDPDLLLSRPETMHEAEQLYNRVWPESIASTPDGKALERALLGYMQSFVPTLLVLFRGVPRMLTRELLNQQLADVLEVQLSWFDRVALKTLVRTIRRLSHLIEGSYADLPASRIAAEWLFRLMAKGFLGIQRGENRHPFDIPAELAHDKWRLDQ